MPKTRTAGKNIKVTIEQFDDDLERALRNPRLVEEPLRGMLEAGTEVGRLAAREEVDGGAHIAVRSIIPRVRPPVGRVVSAMPRPRVQSIEKGRKPGASVPLSQLVRWVEAVGYPQSAYELRRRIRREGVKAKRFMLGAQEAVRVWLPKGLQEMGQAVRARWDRGGGGGR